MLAVNPTRMELLSLRRRVTLAVRGHRLLSEKRDEISRRLVTIAREIEPLRRQVEENLLQTSRRFMMAHATMEPENVRAALEVPTAKFTLTIAFASIMNVRVPHFTKDISGDIICYGYAATSGEMDVALKGRRPSTILSFWLKRKNRHGFLPANSNPRVAASMSSSTWSFPRFARR